MLEKVQENCAACTIISRNYLPFARTLCHSYRKLHAEHSFYVLIVDRRSSDDHFELEPFVTYYAEEIGIPDFLRCAFKFDILELNTNVKPSFLKYLFENTGIEKLVYFDPDIFFYNRADRVFELLDQYSIIVTPHCVEPVQDEWRPSEQDFLKAGVFNLGFIALRRSPESLKMLQWWEKRCLSQGFNEVQNGLFVDQCWINFILCFFESVYVLKDRGYNMAYWNLHERRLSKDEKGYWVNQRYPLVFFHFSGIILEAQSVDISRHQNRFCLKDRQDLTEVFVNYRDALKCAGYERQVDYRYSYGYYSNGLPVSRFARRLFDGKTPENMQTDPFDSKGKFFQWAKRVGAVDREICIKRYTSLNYNRHDLRIRLIHLVLRILLKIVGVERYTLLMQYLSYISILRNQKDLF